MRAGHGVLRPRAVSRLGNVMCQRFFCFLFFCLPSLAFAQTVDCPSVKLAGFSLTDDQGVLIGVGVATMFCVAGIFKVLAKTGNERDDD